MMYKDKSHENRSFMILYIYTLQVVFFSKKKNMVIIVFSPVKSTTGIVVCIFFSVKLTFYSRGVFQRNFTTVYKNK